MMCFIQFVHDKYFRGPTDTFVSYCIFVHESEHWIWYGVCSDCFRVDQVHHRLALETLLRLAL